MNLQGKNWLLVSRPFKSHIYSVNFNILSTLKRTSKNYIRKNILYKDISIYTSSEKHIKQPCSVLYKIKYSPSLTCQYWQPLKSNLQSFKSFQGLDRQSKNTVPNFNENIVHCLYKAQMDFHSLHKNFQ